METDTELGIEEETVDDPDSESVTDMVGVGGGVMVSVKDSDIVSVSLVLIVMERVGVGGGVMVSVMDNDIVSL